MNRAEKSSFWRTLATRERVGWIAYDWANSAFVLCVITVIGSAYFVGVFEAAAHNAGHLAVGPAPAMRIGGVAVTAEAAWSLVVGLSAAIVAFSSPLLGAIADGGGHKMRFLRAYCLTGAVATACLWVGMPWWAVGLLVLIGNVGFEGGNVFYNAFLPEIAGPAEQDAVSSGGYAFGYIGGVLALILALIFFVPPRGDVHNAFLLVGAWWAGFALVTFALVPERGATRSRPAGVGPVRGAWREVRTTLGHVARMPQAALFLGAFLLYNDGIATLISNATPYALQNIYLDRALTQHITLNELIPAIIMIQIIAFPGSLFCGWLATRYGEKAALYFSLVVFAGVVTYGQVVTQLAEFYVMCALIGVVLGGSQAISRSLFASFVPAGRNAEFFAFFALSSKFSAMLGPLVYGALLLLTGETRLALLSLTVFFVAGGVLLYFVNIERGRADAARMAI
ncbi:MAG TPA: MFS transporter [bacterium]|nr:MFS transporter [bacterium]